MRKCKIFGRKLKKGLIYFFIGSIFKNIFNVFLAVGVKVMLVWFTVFKGYSKVRTNLARGKKSE